MIESRPEEPRYLCTDIDSFISVRSHHAPTGSRTGCTTPFDGRFSLYIRADWTKKGILDDSRQPQAIVSKG
jgi:hypothetical protein